MILVAESANRCLGEDRTMGPTEFSSLADVAWYLQRTGRPVRASASGELAQCSYERGGATVAVTLRQLVYPTGSRWLGLSIPICAAERVRPRAALVAAGALPVGALALWQDQVLVRQTLPLGGLAAEPLEQALRALVDAAAELAAVAARAASGARTPHGDPFP